MPHARRGRLATITHDPPPPGRDIAVHWVEVEPGGARLARLAGLAAQGALTLTVAGPLPLEQAGQALAQVRRGTRGAPAPAATSGRGTHQLPDIPDQWPLFAIVDSHPG